MTGTTDYDRGQWPARPLAREGAAHQQTRNCLTATKILFLAPDMCLTPKQIGRLIVGRNVNLTLTWTQRFASQPPSNEDVKAKAKEYPLLEAVTQQRVVET
jgi:hypothetical protein